MTARSPTARCARRPSSAAIVRVTFRPSAEGPWWTSRRSRRATATSLLLVGTMKGAFLLRPRPARASGTRRPLFSRATPSTRWPRRARAGRRRRCAPAGSEHWGAVLSSSDDFGRTWTDARERAVRFPEDTGAVAKRIWQIIAGRDDEPDSALLRRRARRAVRVARRRRDLGARRGLWDHPHRAKWQPGGGGLCLHTILADPEHREPHAGRDLDRRRLPHRRRRRHVAGAQPRRARRVPARQASRVRPVRAQGRAAIRRGPSGCSSRTTGGSTAATTAATRGRTSPTACPRDFGFAMAMHPARPRHRVHRAARVRHVPLHARGQAARLPHARRRRLVGAAHARPAAEGRARDRAARRAWTPTR